MASTAFPQRRPGSSTKLVGLTGNIGSGKSSVARLLEGHGAAVIDSDSLAREATRDGQVLERISRELGEDLVANGSLDRKRMARLVFEDVTARKRLEGIIHPWVRARSRAIGDDLLNSEHPPAAIVHDIPLLYENGLEDNFDSVVVVIAPREVRAQRAAARDGLSLEEFLARDAAQLPAESKQSRADWVIDNSGDLASLEAQVAALWQEIVTS